MRRGARCSRKPRSRSEIERLLGVYSTAGDPVVFVAWAGRISGGTPSPGPEALEVGFFAPDELPDLPFPHDPAIIEAWRRARGDGGEGGA